jgi:hypothetical protein
LNELIAIITMIKPRAKTPMAPIPVKSAALEIPPPPVVGA